MFFRLHKDIPKEVMVCVFPQAVNTRRHPEADEFKCPFKHHLCCVCIMRASVSQDVNIPTCSLWTELLQNPVSSVVCSSVFSCPSSHSKQKSSLSEEQCCDQQRDSAVYRPDRMSAVCPQLMDCDHSVSCHSVFLCSP